jgi:hypothetical protein
MPFGRKGQISELYIVPQPADKQPMISPPDGDIHEFSSVAVEIIERWGLDTRLTGELARDLSEKRGHTIDHIDCPSCRAYDVFVKSDLLGMAGQRFEDAARVWESAQRKSDKLRPRTLESLADYLRSLNRFFKNIRMSSINPGMLKAYQEARKSNAIGVGGKIHRPWKRLAGHSRINHELNVLGQMLRACNEWEKIRPYYFPLKTNSWSPREILSEKEEEELFRKVAGYPRLQFTHAIGRRVDVESGRQSPEFPIHMQEAVIAQVVVHICNQNREGNAPPQLFDIGSCVGPVYANCVHDLGVGMFLGFRRLNAQHGRGGHIHYAMAVVLAIEAADECDRQIFALDDTRRGCIDPGLSGKRQSEHFSFGHGALVCDARKLADRERAVFVYDRAFRAHAAKRRAPAA